MSRSRLAAAAVLAAALFSLAGADDQPAPLKFAWPVPSKATVTEKVEKVGHTATTRYTLSVERSGEGGDLRLHLGDFEFLDLDGKPATDPSLAQQLKVALPMAKAIPDILIGADGSVKDVLGLDTAIATMLDELSKNLDEREKASLPQLRAQFEAPETREKMKREASKQWTAWVAEWAGRTIPEGRGVDGTHAVSCPDGAEVMAPTLLRRMPAENEGPGLVKLTRETTLDGEDAKPAFEAWLKKAEAALGRSLGATGMRLVDRIAAVTDPSTLRPTWVRREEQRILHMKDADDRNDIERHEYQFEWPAAGTPKPTTSPKPAETPNPPETGK